MPRYDVEILGVRRAGGVQLQHHDFQAARDEGAYPRCEALGRDGFERVIDWELCREVASAGQRWRCLRPGALEHADAFHEAMAARGDAVLPVTVEAAGATTMAITVSGQGRGSAN